MSEVDEWLTYADEDLRTAGLCFENEIWNQACFHAQQCVEKVLKAVLIAQGAVYPRSHSLPELLNRLDRARFAPLFVLSDRIRLVDRFYMATRYPDSIPGALPDRLPDGNDATETLATAEQVSDIAKGILRAP